MTTIHLDSNQIPQALRTGYQGRKFQARVCETMTVPADAGLWSGGSRDSYRMIRLDDGATVPFPGQESSPWNGARRDYAVTLQPGFAVVCHSMFSGKDAGLTFYIHPSNAAALLPAPAAALSPVERLVLVATRSLKSSYAGRDRYQMARDESHCVRALGGADYPSREQWDAAKGALAARGLLNKAGAITPAGRNAAQ